jgi:hypothetical protein
MSDALTIATGKLRGETASAPSTPAVDNFVPDPIVARELGTTLMGLHRLTHDPDLNFPPAIKIRGRNFRSRRALEEFKAAQIRKAIAGRSAA